MGQGIENRDNHISIQQVSSLGSDTCEGISDDNLCAYCGSY